MALPDYGHPLNLALDVKRIRLKWNDAAARYLVTDEVELAMPADGEKKEEDEPTYAFSLVRQFMRMDEVGPFHLENKYIEVESPAFVAAAQEVMKGRRDIAWGRKPLQKDELIAFMGAFTNYVDDLEKGETAEEQEQVEHVRFLMSFLRTEYREHIRDLENLRSLQVTTFELIWSIMLPGMILLTWDAMTATPRAVRLVSLEMTHGSSDKPRSWTLHCEFVTVNGDTPGIAEITFSIPHFIGAKRILELAAYPFEQLSIPDQEAKKLTLIERGKKCWRLKTGVTGTMTMSRTLWKTKSRIILDDEMYNRYCRNGGVPNMICDLDGEVPFPESRKDLDDDEYFLMSPRLYGYTLADRDWLMFHVDRIEDIQWSDTVFQGLDMDPEDKKLVKTLVEEHTGMAIDTEANKKLGITARKFDDFVESKGLGLIFNLHGASMPIRSQM
ncbi:hypothetical protein EWM64_g5142 [Hericium alpestre]|uniref:DUF7025 domain-containing protein n=1 Tax=Hericium alpestre TaxID=135208 RepID=A0A4Y9ZVN2_9AGAM|nr:hypothetical protein EWM64_g5142 [Hericium alpestre]